MHGVKSNKQRIQTHTSSGSENTKGTIKLHVAAYSKSCPPAAAGSAKRKLFLSHKAVFIPDFKSNLQIDGVV